MTMRCIAALLALHLAGCATASIEDAVPTAALQPEEASAETPAAADGDADAPGPVFSEPGTYPNLNVVPTPASEQFTPVERQAEAAALRARRQQLAEEVRRRNVRDSTADLRRLAQGHADTALKEIEGR